MPVAKKAAAKKTAAKKTAAVKKAAGTGPGRQFSPDMDLAEKIAKMRDGGAKWEGVAEKFNLGTGRAMLLNMLARTPANERISFKDDSDLGPKVVKARGNGLSWGAISARTGVGEAKLRSLFETAGGGSAKGNRIGKGGRYPTGTTPPKKAAPVKKAAKAKKAGKAAKATKRATKEAG